MIFYDFLVLFQKIQKFQMIFQKSSFAIKMESPGSFFMLACTPGCRVNAGWFFACDVLAFVCCHLYHCNSLYRSLWKFNQHKLQWLKNTAPRIVTNTGRFTSATAVLKGLHWLPFENCAIFTKCHFGLQVS